MILIYLILLFVNFFPKISIISFGNNPTGIRIEDVLIFLFVFLYFINRLKIKKNKEHSNENFNKIKKIFFIYFTCCVVSSFLGSIRGFVDPLMAFLFTIRKLEYFSLFFIGYLFAKKKRTLDYKIIDFITIFHFIFTILQLKGLIGSFNHGEALDVLAQGRITSTFNGAYEFSAFLLFLLTYYLVNIFDNKNRTIINIIYIIMIIFCIFQTQSRTSLIIALILFIIILLKSKNIRLKNIIGKIIISCSIITIPFLVINFNKLDLTRFDNLNINKTNYLIQYTWKYKNFDKYKNDRYWYGDSPFTLNQIDNMGYDGSLYQRLSHWMQLIDGFIKYPLFGLGLSISGSSVDGNYIRILTESGIIGLILWLYLLINIYRGISSKSEQVNKIVKLCFISVIIGSLFIDLFESSKVIMPLWFLIGFSIYKKEEC